MKIKLVSTFIAFFSCMVSITLGQHTQLDSGFTNKADATNQTVNGIKEGKWIEYFDSSGHGTDNTNSVYYKLTIYKKGKQFERGTDYYKSGKILKECYYTDGKKNGIAKWYYEGGS